MELVHHDPWGFIIGDQRVQSQSQATRAVENPTTGEVLTQVPEGNSADVDRAVQMAHTAFVHGPWGRISGWERAQHLRNLAATMRSHLPELVNLEIADAGKPRRETESSVFRAAACFDYYADLAGRQYGETIPMPATNLLDYTLREPFGVCALIAPWNNPLLLAAWKVAPALAAGNTVILKPSELTPLTSLRLGEIALEAGLPPGVLNVITGAGQVGQELCTHPLVHKISFTGSTATGRIIMRQASDTLKSIALELGGKSPNLVFADAMVDKAVQGAVEGMFVNTGQSCTAKSRLFVQRPLLESFVERLQAAVSALVIGDPDNPATEIGPLISEQHRQRVLGYVTLGIEEGAEVSTGGQSVTGMPGYFVEPTVLIKVQNSMRVAQEEIFGPVIVVIPFDTEEEGVKLANDSLFGLGASIWTSNLGRAHRIARQLKAGNISINYPKVNPQEAPFGGYGQSGLGRELGPHAMDLYTQIKNVLIDIAV